MKLRAKQLQHLTFFVSIIISAIAYLTTLTFVSPFTRTVKLTEFFALSALVCLYLVLLAISLSGFIQQKWNQHLELVKSTLLPITLYFALIHICLAFFGELGGFTGLPFLNDRYLLTVGLGLISLGLLAVVASRAWDFISQQKYSLFTKVLLYLMGVTTLVHAFMLGNHFHDLGQIAPFLSFLGIGILALLEGWKLDKYVRKRFASWQVGPVTLLVVIILLASSNALFFNPNNASLSVHSHAEVGGGDITMPAAPSQAQFTKNVGNYRVTLVSTNQIMTFSIAANDNSQVVISPATSLMIMNSQTLDYVEVPSTLMQIASQTNKFSVNIVSFKFSPGIYTLNLRLHVNNEVIPVEFNIELNN